MGLQLGAAAGVLRELWGQGGPWPYRKQGTPRGGFVEDKVGAVCSCLCWRPAEGHSDAAEGLWCSLMAPRCAAKNTMCLSSSQLMRKWLHRGDSSLCSVFGTS